MVGTSFSLFVTNTVAHNGGSYTISVLRKIHSEIIFMITCLEVRCLFIEVGVRLPEPLLLICWSYIIMSLNTRYKVFLVSFLF